MTAQRAFIIRCDARGCGAVTDYAPGESKRKAQEEARELGWHTTRRVDYCPQHRRQLQHILDALPQRVS